MTSVAVLGAGMAGLVAATELAASGYDVTLLEARDEVGGRVRTLRKPFADGLRAELGAMRIPRTHSLVLGYGERLGLRLLPFLTDDENAFTLSAGKRHRLRDARNDPSLIGGLTSDETRVGVPAMWSQLVEEFRDSPTPDAFHQVSLRQHLANHGWSEAAQRTVDTLRLHEVVYDGASSETLGEAAAKSYSDVVHIDGGMDRLPLGLAAPLMSRISFRSEVTAIAQDERAVTVTFRRDGRAETLTADAAIVTLPLTVLRSVDTRAALPQETRDVISRATYDRALKIFFQTRRKFWLEDHGIVGGTSSTDLPIRVVYYPPQSDGRRGILLASYTWAGACDYWDALSPEQRISAAREQVAQLHPQIADDFELGVAHAWHEDPHARGAFSAYGPGEWLASRDRLCAREGRVILAGEHASERHAWIEGAVESALRAVAQITAFSAASA